MASKKYKKWVSSTLCDVMLFILINLKLIVYFSIHSLGKKSKMSVLEGNSDDDGGPNTYDYNDSFIDDDELSG